MAIIVDKDEKRNNIALACKNLVINASIKDITISQIAQVAHIAKGSFYDYFDDKEDLLFHIVTILMDEYNKKTEIKLNNAKNIKEQLKLFAEFFYSDEDIQLREIYKKFISIALINENDKMKHFQTQCYDKYKNWLEQIINEAIIKGELKPEVLSLVNGLFSTAKGLYIIHETTNSLDSLQNEINNYIDMIYQLTKVEK